MTHLEQLKHIESIICNYCYLVNPNEEELNTLPDLVRKARDKFDEEEAL